MPTRKSRSGRDDFKQVAGDRVDLFNRFLVEVRRLDQGLYGFQCFLHLDHHRVALDSRFLQVP